MKTVTQKPGQMKVGIEAGSSKRVGIEKHFTGLRKKYYVTLAMFAAFFVLVFLAAPTIGSTKIDLSKVFDSRVPFDDNVDAQIFLITRLPRILLATFTGAALAVAGLVFQATLGNPLATPYTLGIASGASLGAVLSIRTGLVIVVLGISSLVLSAFAGALLTMFFIYLLTKRGSGLSPTVMLLAGVSLNFLFSALMLFVHFLSDFTQSYQMLRWLMGGLDVIDYHLISSTGLFVVIMLVLMMTISRDLNLISNGEEMALMRGVDVSRTKKIAYFGASFMTAAVVCVCGPIGFVGLVVPHSLRLLVGPDNRLLMPVSMFFGASFLIICDTLARTIIAPLEIPVGVITAIVGSPFFIWLLLRERRRISF